MPGIKIRMGNAAGIFPLFGGKSSTANDRSGPSRVGKGGFEVIENTEPQELTPQQLEMVQSSWKYIFDRSSPPQEFIVQKSCGYISYLNTWEWFFSEFHSKLRQTLEVS